MRKKAISLVMVLAMVLSLMPTFALADTTVAMIGSQNYATLAEAVAAAKDGDTITLQTDTSETLPVPSIANLTIDLGNHKLTMLNSETMVISGGKELTLQNGSVVSTVFTDGTKSNFNILTGSSMTLNKVKFDTTGVALYPRGDAAKVTVTDSEIKCGVYAVATNAATAANYNVVITLTNSTFTSTYGYNKDNASDKYDSCPVMINVPGTLNMTGCTVNGTRQGVLVRGGTAAIKNSTINLDAEFTTGKDKYWTANWGNGDEVPMAAVVVGNRNTGYKYPASCTLEDTTVTTTSDYKAIYVYGMDAAERLVKLDIKGNSNVSGPITKEEAASGAALVSISGGYFTSDPTSYKAEGAFIFTSDKAGYNYLVSSTGVASVGTTQYASVQAAVTAVADAAKSGTVTMERNSTENVTILAGTTVTLDLNGKTLTGANSCADAAWGDLENQNTYTAIVNKGKLTIEDSSSEKTGRVTAAGIDASVLYTDVGAETTLNGGTYTTSVATGSQSTSQNDNWYVIRNHGTMTMNTGVKVTCGGTYSLNGNTMITNGYEQFENNGKEIHLSKNALMTINGGTYEGGIFVIKNGDWDGEMTINGGTFSIKDTTSGDTSNWGAVVSNSNNCTMTINNGTFIGAAAGKDPVVKAKTKSAASEGGGLTIKSGTFSGPSDVLQTLKKSSSPAAIINVIGGNFKGTINNDTEATGEGASRSYEIGASELKVTGGYFTADPTAYVAAGYKAVSGSYTVGNATYGYKVGAKPATTISAATAKVYNGSTEVTTEEAAVKVSGSTLAVSGKISSGNKVVVSYTDSDGTAHADAVTISENNGTFSTTDTVTVGSISYSINVSGLSVLPTEVKVVAGKTATSTNPELTSAPAVSAAASAAASAIANPGGTTVTGLTVAATEEVKASDNAGTATSGVATNEGIKTTADATKALTNEGVTVGDSSSVKIVVEPYLDITVTGVDVATPTTPPTIESITLDIKPMYNVKATTADTTGAMNETNGSGKNTVTLATAQPMTVTTPVTISIKLPDGFVVTENFFVKHVHNGVTSYYKAFANSETHVATFTVTDGFSDFTFTADNRTATIDFGNYVTGTNAATYDPTNVNGTLPIPDTATNFAGWKFSGVDGTYTTMTDALLNTLNGKTVTATPVYNTPSASTGGGTSAAFTVTVNKSDNGTVTSSAASAAASATVTLTVAPATGYVLDALTVTDSTTKAVATAKVSDTSYTFTMPALNVTVTPTFKKTSAHVSAKFTDVDPKGWYVDAIDYVVTKGLFNGITDTTFEPDSAMDRAMLVTVMYRLAGSPAVTGTHSFTDVPADAYYKTALLWAVQNKVVNGITDTTFGPTLPVTREQVAAILYRYAKANGADVSIGEDTNILSYDDAFEISEYAIPAFQWACGSGILQGDNNKLMPKNNATRAQIAAIMMRSAGKLTK